MVDVSKISEDSEIDQEFGATPASPLFNHIIKASKGCLGFGYDINGDYANEKSAKASLFTIAVKDNGFVLVAEGATDRTIAVNASFHQKNDIHTGTTENTFLEGLSKTVSIKGGYLAFSGAIKASFNESQSNTGNRSFISHRQVITVGTLTMPPSCAAYLTDDARKMLENHANFKELFDEYGTHYIHHAIVGGRLEYNYLVNAASEEHLKSLKAAVSAQFRPGGKQDADDTPDPSSEKPTEPTQNPGASVGKNLGFSARRRSRTRTKLSEELTDFKVRAVGGSHAINDEDDIKPWAASIKSAPALCEFNDRSLRPIWDLISDPTRRAKVQAAAEAYLKAGVVKKAAFVHSVLLKPNENLVRLATDKGSKCERDLSMFGVRADNQNGWYSLGHVVESHYGNPRAGTRMIKEITSGALAAPLEAVKVYDDAGSQAANDFSFWRILPPSGYVALGFLIGNGHSKPSLGDIRCVHESLVVKAQPGAIVWANTVYAKFTGTEEVLTPSPYVLATTRSPVQKGNSQVVLYDIAVPADAIDCHLFYAQGDYSQPNPMPQLYALKKSAAKDA